MIDNIAGHVEANKLGPLYIYMHGGPTGGRHRRTKLISWLLFPNHEEPIFIMVMHAW